MTPDPELAQVLQELKQREPIFHRPEFGVERTDFEQMTADDFWEVGASGKRYDRTFVLEELERRRREPHDDVWECSDFACRRLGSETFLLTYALLQDGWRRTRRSTIWQRTGAGWKILYHQGTIVQEG